MKRMLPVRVRNGGLVAVATIAEDATPRSQRISFRWRVMWWAHRRCATQQQESRRGKAVRASQSLPRMLRLFQPDARAVKTLLISLPPSNLSFYIR